MKKSKKDKQLENLLFEVYEKGVNNADCDLTTYIEKIKKALTIQRVSQQRELLWAFVNTMEFDVRHETDEENIEYFLKENNSL